LSSTVWRIQDNPSTYTDAKTAKLQKSVALKAWLNKVIKEKVAAKKWPQVVEAYKFYLNNFWLPTLIAQLLSARLLRAAPFFYKLAVFARISFLFVWYKRSYNASL